MKRIFLIVSFIFIFLFPLLNLTAQNVNKRALEMINTSKEKTKNIYKNKKIKFSYEGVEYKGNLDSIAVNSIFVNNEEFKINKINFIKIKFRSTQITGGIIGGLGILVDGLGLDLLFTKQDNGCGAALAVVLGVVITVFGIIVTTVGTVVFIIGKKYKFNNDKWTLKIVQQSQ